MAQNENTKVEKAPLTAEEIFENTAKVVAARARDIAKSVKLWRDGESELEDLILEVQLGQRKMQKALAAMAQAHKTLTGK